MLKIKSGAKVSRQVIIAAGVTNAAEEVGLVEDMVITSGNDSKHKPGSKHYSDEALDFRTKHLPSNAKEGFAEAVQKRLGPDYDVILESEGGVNEHLHVEFDPKRKSRKRK